MIKPEQISILNLLWTILIRKGRGILLVVLPVPSMEPCAEFKFIYLI